MFKYILYLCALAFSSTSLAITCTGALNNIGPETIEMGRIRVPKNVAPWTILKSIDVVFGRTANFQCTNIGRVLNEALVLTLDRTTLSQPRENFSVWELKNSGVAIAVSPIELNFFLYPPQGSGLCQVLSPGRSDGGGLLRAGSFPLYLCGDYVGTTNNGMALRVMFFRVNNPSSQNIILNNAPAVKMALNASPYKFNLLDLYINGSIVHEDEPCTVNPNSKSIIVNMGKKTVADFPTIGSIAAEKSFNIPFNCEIPNRKVLFGFQGTAVPGLESQGILQSSSPGMGIQLLNMNPGKPLTLALNSKSEAKLVNDSATTANLAFAVRYYRTGNLTPGPANATATFTITYQ